MRKYFNIVDPRMPMCLVICTLKLITVTILDPTTYKAEETCLETLELLIKHGLDVKTVDSVHPLLPMSTRMCAIRIMTELLKEGADIHGKDLNGRTALLRCCALNGL